MFCNKSIGVCTVVIVRGDHEITRKKHHIDHFIEYGQFTYKIN
jgi:hypothetical protein